MNEATPGWGETVLYAVMPWMVLINQVPLIGIVVQLALAFIAVLIIHHVGTRILLQLSAPMPITHRLVEYGHKAGAFAVFLLAAQVILRSASDQLPGITAARHLSALGLITALTWLSLRCVRAVEHGVEEMYPAGVPNNLQARRVQTQTKVLARSAMALILLVGLGAALMTLPMLRQIGTSLLASAGVAGLIVGLAAKPVLGNLLAGIQLALTQPIRLDDVVIVQNEWGQVEEITGTYVVVRLWDQRRMIVPLQWFIEHPFQNWTRASSEILGTVNLWVDYRMPLDPLRKEAERICHNAPEWDGRLCQIQVVDANDRAMQVRVLVSAGDAGRAWDLRCRMREGLIDFVQRQYLAYLPRVRAEVGEPDSGRGEDAGIPVWHAAR